MGLPTYIDKLGIQHYKSVKSVRNKDHLQLQQEMGKFLIVC